MRFSNPFAVIQCALTSAMVTRRLSTTVMQIICTSVQATKRDRLLLTVTAGRPYSGCYVNATITIFAYDNQGKGISASLGGVQFFRDGDAFAGGGVASEDDFDDLSVAEEEESLI